MTTHNVKGLIAFSCDECAEAIEPEDQRDLGTAWAEARVLGWRAARLEWGRYEHQCPACASAESRSE